MVNRNIYIGIAIIVVGLFAMPNIVSVYTGSHTWGDPKQQDGVRCQKCHQSIYDEVRAQGYTDHTPHVFMDESGEIHYFECLECHTVEYSIADRFQNDNPNLEAPGHTVTTVPCLACHGAVVDSHEMHALAEKYGMDFVFDSPYCGKCHDMHESGFPETDTFICNIDHELIDDSHAGFILDVINQTGNANKACMGCHSNVGVDIEWSAIETINMIVDNNGTRVI